MDTEVSIFICMIPARGNIEKLFFFAKPQLFAAAQTILLASYPP